MCKQLSQYLKQPFLILPKAEPYLGKLNATSCPTHASSFPVISVRAEPQAKQGLLESQEEVAIDEEGIEMEVLSTTKDDDVSSSVDSDELLDRRAARKLARALLNSAQTPLMEMSKEET